MGLDDFVGKVPQIEELWTVEMRFHEADQAHQKTFAEEPRGPVRVETVEDAVAVEVEVQVGQVVLHVFVVFLADVVFDLHRDGLRIVEQVRQGLARKLNEDVFLALDQNAVLHEELDAVHPQHSVQPPEVVRGDVLQSDAEPVVLVVVHSRELDRLFVLVFAQNLQHDLLDRTVLVACGYPFLYPCPR